MKSGVQMANTFSKIYIQIVFSTFKRLPLLHPQFKTDVYKYITGIIQNKGHKLIAINGMSDHVHIFINLKPNESISDLVRDIKRNSTQFINSNQITKGKFQWQTGFGVFSYSESQIDVVCKYIQNQETHHKRKTFKDEYREFLKSFDIEFDERYVFD